MTERVGSSARQFTAMQEAKRRAFTLTGVLCLGLLLGGCRNGSNGSIGSAGSNGSEASTPASPQTAGQTAAAQSTTPPPVAAPVPAPPTQYVVPRGTSLAVRMEQDVSAAHNDVGDSFRGSLAHPVLIQGVTVLRAGTPVTGTVVAAKGRGKFKGAGDLAIAIRRVGNYAVTTTSYARTESGKGKRTAGFIGGGGGGGALIGGLAGGGKGALIGGLLGAGAGTAGAALSGNKDISIPVESVVTFTLTKSITVEERH